MPRRGYLAFLSLFLCIALRSPPVLSWYSPSASHSGNDPSVVFSSIPNFKPKPLSRRNTDSRRVYLLFQARSLPPRNTTSLLTAPTSTIHINLQLEPGSFLGAWPYTTIQLVKTPVDYNETTSGHATTKQIFQLWFTQMTAPLGLPISHLPDGQEISLRDTHLMKFYLGTTTASDNTILELHTGSGLLLQVIRALPQITAAPGQTRGAFMRDLVQALDIQPSSEMRADLIARMNNMIDLAQTNDMRTVYSDGHLVRDVFPDYRIPCIAHYQLNTLGSTGTAYNVLDNTEPSRSGKLRAMEAFPNSTAFHRFLQKFAREPWWDGNLDDGSRNSTSLTKSDQ